MQPGHLTDLTGQQVEAVNALATAVHSHDGLAAFDENTLLTLDRPGLPRYLTSDAGGALTGFAQVNDTSAEIAVHPDHRRRGLGAALVRAVLQGHPGVRLWAHGNLPAARAIAAANNLSIVRELWVMARPGPRPDEFAPVRVPEDVRVRTFEVGKDEDAWLRVNARAFADHPEQGGLELADLQARQSQDWFDPETFWLAEDADNGELLGSMWVKITGATPTSAGGTGEIYVLGVDPSAQGRGVGGLLTVVAMADFARRGLGRLELYVEADNAPAIATYRRVGFDRDIVHVQYTAEPPADHRVVSR